MKRYVIKILSLLSLLSVALVAVSCSDVRYEKYQPYVEKREVAGTPISYEECFSSLNYYEKGEYDLPKAGESITFDFLNETYTGQYRSSSSEAYGKNMYELSYIAENGNEFIINENGQVVGFSVKNPKDIRQAVTEDTKKSPEQIEAIVSSMIHEIYGETDIEFLIELSGPHNMPTDWGEIYSANISYNIDGYQTSESLILNYALDGTLLSMLSNNLGRFDGKSVPDDFNKEKADGIISDMFRDETEDYFIRSYILDILEDGSLAMKSTVEITVDELVNSFAVIIPLE